MSRASPRARGWRDGVAAVLSLAIAFPAAAQDAPVPTPAAAPASADATTAMATAIAPGPTPAAARPPVLARESMPAWTLATLPDEPVPFHGMVNMDYAGLGSGNMLYPTAGLGVLGLLVGVATHAALVSGSRSSQESKLQQAADKVIDPYRAALARFLLRDLERSALAATSSAAVAHLREVGEAPADDVFVQASPSFAMTPDSAALVLDATVVVRTSPTSDKGTQQVLRVVSAPRPEPDLQAAWSAGEGAALKSTAAALMAQSLDIALLLSRHPADDKQPFRTLRYGLGDRERMERGQLLEETCDRLVIRTLRGALLVAPHKAGAALPEGCPPLPAAPERVATPAPAPAASAVAAAASAVS